MRLNSKFCSVRVDSNVGDEYQSSLKDIWIPADSLESWRKYYTGVSCPFLSCPLLLGVHCNKSILSPLTWLRNVHKSTSNCCRFYCLHHFFLLPHYLNFPPVCYQLFPCTTPTLQPSSMAQTGKVECCPPFSTRAFHLPLAPVTYSKWLLQARFWPKFSVISLK